jgi:diaminopimelate decarboxylase
MAAMTSTVLPEDSEVRDGRLLVGGCDTIELAREFGTPAYIVAEADLRSRARAFKAALAAHHDGPGDVIFASKAFPCTAVLRAFADEGLAVDVASGGELHLALRAGFDPEKIYLHGNAKSHSELAAALDCGVGHIVVDNFEDIDRLDRLATETQRILIRVTPGVEAATHAKIATGQHDSKFGFTMADAVEAIARAESSDKLELAGLHMHIGSQLFDLQPYRAAIKVLATLGDFGTYDLGGGLGAPYTAGDRPLALEDWVAGLAGTLRDRVGPGKRLLLEPGRALVANAGVTLYRVETVKQGTRIWVAVDGGMSDNLRPMLYGAAYEAHVADRFDEEGEPCTIVGKHCESGDVLAEDIHLPDARPGDVLVMPGTGAYGHAMANNYNGVPRPPVVFAAGGHARAVVRRETFEDLHHRDVG